MAGDLATLTRDYWIAVQRVRRLPVPMIDKQMVLADVEAVYRAERDRLATCRGGLRDDGTDVGTGGDSPLST